MGIKNPVANVTTGTGPITGWNNTIEPIAYARNTGTEAIPVKILLMILVLLVGE